ncbi:MAG: YbaB/EbfC family nucleoid-associated protein [Rhodospirillaceae bacterium]|jgi:nucleoid-associated protein EbfC|nr:YbaB/EbfC family nucleoid-associated protein [Rhodospirillaceae bacterium]MBT5809808.1 YbaB/EbfC family nucleoid-associated protein [Rhodospirillaceae bacterium]
MKNLGQIMKQAQEMQTKMAEMQENLVNVEITGESAAGMVTVTLNGKGGMVRVKVDPSLINPADAEVMEDLIVAAHNDARAKVDARMQEETSKMMGGIQLPPGLKLPF